MVGTVIAVGAAPAEATEAVDAVDVGDSEAVLARDAVVGVGLTTLVDVTSTSCCCCCCDDVVDGILAVLACLVSISHLLRLLLCLATSLGCWMNCSVS